MTKVAAVAFAALVLATVAAFFVTQHLKVSTPLIAGNPTPVPGVINPSGPPCPVRLASGGTLPNHREMHISFYLLHRSDDVAVYVVDASGTIVRTLATARHMRKGVRNPDGEFVWDGREDDGRVAPDGTYGLRVSLLRQGRTVDLSSFSGRAVTVAVNAHPPRPQVTRVAPAIVPQDSSNRVKIDYGQTAAGGAAYVLIFRTDLPGKPRLVKSFRISSTGSRATWDGLIHGRPAAQGTYLIGIRSSNSTCAAGQFPPSVPPPAGSTPHAGVTVRHLVAEPPLTPVSAGAAATVYVDARQRPYTWKLWRTGAGKPAAAGDGHAVALTVRPPAGQGAGLYRLVIDSGPYATQVPLVASARPSSRRPRVLVVLPALTWQGENPVDDTGDGLPSTLDAGDPVRLDRPLVAGLPAEFADEGGLLSYLDRSRLPYDLTTDLGLIEGSGPQLAGHSAVVLAGPERWIPSALGQRLRSYVLGGGHVVSVGIGSLLRTVTLSGRVARAPSAPAGEDPLGARPGPVTATGGELITVIRDGLGIFSTTSGALPGFRSFGVIAAVAAPGQIVSAAGTTGATESVVGYRLGRGIVVDLALPGFGSSLAGNPDAGSLVSRLWAVLGR